MLWGVLDARLRFEAVALYADGVHYEGHEFQGHLGCGVGLGATADVQQLGFEFA